MAYIWKISFGWQFKELRGLYESDLTYYTSLLELHYIEPATIRIPGGCASVAGSILTSDNILSWGLDKK